MEKELDFDPLIPVAGALKKWWLAAIAALAAGLLAFVYTESGNLPQYRVACTVAVCAPGEAAPVPSAQRARAFAEVVTSPVIAALEESEGIRLRGRLRAQVLEQTNIVTLTVTAEQGQRAMEAMLLLLERHPEITREAAGELMLEILEPPVLPAEPEPMANPAKAFLKAAGIAMGLVFVLLVVYDGTRNRVRSPEEAVRKLGLPCLGLLHRRSRKNTNRWEQELDRLARRIDQSMGGGIVLLAGQSDPEFLPGLARHLECRGRSVMVTNRILKSMETDYGLLSLPVADALELLEQADGVLLMVRHNRTNAEEANRAGADLSRGRARMLGCMVWDFWSTGRFDGEAAAAGWYTGKGVWK